MKIGIRHRRRGFIDKMLTAKRAETARMLAGLPPASTRRPSADIATALARPEGAPLRLIAAVYPPPEQPDPPGAPEAPEDPATALSPVEIASLCARGGARALIAATDEHFLRGSFEVLAICRDALDDALGERRPPLIADDFFIHPIQLDRAAAAGADAVILIARLLPGDELRALADAATQRGLEPIVEVDSEEAIEQARFAGARLLGVHGRDLNTGKPIDEQTGALVSTASRRANVVLLSEIDAPEGVAAAAGGPSCSARIGGAWLSPSDLPGSLERLTAMVQAAERPANTARHSR